jgi:cytoskeletal protein CcmA (bactofilin family)
MSLFARRSFLPAPASYSVVDTQLLIRGDVTTEGALRIDGRMEGSVQRADTVVVGIGGVIVGDVAAREVVIAGMIHGSIIADERVEVQPSARVHGDVRAPILALHEGGVVHGHLCVEAEGERVDVAAPHLELSGRRAMPALPG